MASKITTAKVDDSAYDVENSGATPSADSLPLVQTLIAEMQRCERAVLDAAVNLQNVSKELADIAEHRLPDLLEQNGLTELKFTDHEGKHRRLVLDRKIVASVVCPHRPRPNAAACEDCRQAAYGWFESIGQGGIIKYELIAPLGRMEQANVDEIVASLKAKFPDLDVATDRSIHAATLSKTVEEILTKGEVVDESIKVTRMRKAVIRAK